MDTATITKTIVVNLQLNKEEADFIANIVQNSFYQNPEDEPQHEREMRESIFYAIKQA